MPFPRTTSGNAVGTVGWASIVAVALALLSGVGCVSLTAPSPPDALSVKDAAQARALAHFAQGLVFEWEERADLEAAVRAYRSAIVEDPTDPELRHMAARVLLDLKRPEEAQAVLEKAVRDLPESAATRLTLGRLAAFRGDHALAAHEFEAAAAAAETPGDRIEALLLAAFAQFNRPEDAKAFRALDAVTSFPDSLADPEAEGDEALAPRIRAIRFALELAELRLDAKDGTHAQSYAEWAAGHATNSLERADVWERLGVAAMRKHLPANAVAALRQATRYDPLRTRALLTAIALERGIRLRKITSDVLVEAVAANPGDTALRIAAARALMEENRPAEAVGHAVAAVAAVREKTPAAPLPPELWLLHGSALERSGKLDDAEVVFRQSLKEHPAFAPVQNYLAYMLAERARALPEAEELVRAALKSEPENAAYLDTLGWVYFQMGRPADALLWLLRAAEDDVQDPTVLDHIGDALERLGRKPESAAYWSMSYRLDSKSQSVAAKLTAMGVDLSRLLPIQAADASPEEVEQVEGVEKID